MTGTGRSLGWRAVLAGALTALVASGSAGCTLNGGRAQDSDSPSSAPSGAVSAAAPTRSAVDWTRVAAEAEPSVVSVSVQGETGAGEGSGVIIDRRGHVLTNNHVVAAAATGGRVGVTLSDGRVFVADITGTDPATDLAVLRIRGTPDVAPLQFGDSEAVEVGQPVMALGNPLGLSHTVTSGIVSALDRPVITQNASSSPREQGLPVVTNAIQTDASINPGNSGGALVDAGGRLIGINSAIATLGSSQGGQSGSIGLGFAIPSNQAEWVAHDLIETGEVQHAYLGVVPKDVLVSANGARREAAGIIEVAGGTPAARAGLRKGDAITAVDDEPVAGAESLVAQIRERQPGTTVRLTVVSPGGGTREISVRFGTRPTS